MSHLRFRNWLILIVFIAILSFPFLNDRLDMITDTANLENRRLAKKPRFDLEHLDPYPAAFDSFYNDNFALRSRIMRGFNYYNCVVLKKSPFPENVIIGSNNWLYMANEDIKAYRGIEKFSEQELLLLKNEFIKRKHYLASRKSKFYILIAPGKAYVHPDNLPYHYRLKHNSTWGEQLIAYMNKYSDIKFVDLFKTFRKLQAPDPLYYSLDNHWNKNGGYYAAQAFLKELKNEFPQIDLIRDQDYEMKTSPRTIGNMKQLLGNLDIYQDLEYEPVRRSGFRAKPVTRRDYTPPAEFPHPAEYEIKKEIPGSDKPRLLIFSDSFGEYVFNYTAESFSRTTKIFGGWRYVIDKNIVEKEKPDVVLLVVHEPLIPSILNNLSP